MIDEQLTHKPCELVAWVSSDALHACLAMVLGLATLVTGLERPQLRHGRGDCLRRLCCIRLEAPTVLLGQASRLQTSGVGVKSRLGLWDVGAVCCCRSFLLSKAGSWPDIVKRYLEFCLMDLACSEAARGGARILPILVL